jgi:hypothetical protein
VVTDALSEWFIGAVRGTNQRGELCGVLLALLWMLEHAYDVSKTTWQSAWTRCTLEVSSNDYGV